MSDAEAPPSLSAALALKKYGQHADVGCHDVPHTGEAQRCTCGLDEILKRLDGETPS